MAPVLGYWNIRGLAEPIRYMLHYLNIEFEDKRYDFGPEPNYFDSEWTRTDKQSLGLAFPNIPYYIDGDVKITQSSAIMRYLARERPEFYFPEEENVKEIVRFEVLEGHVKDLTLNLSLIAYNPDFEKFRPLMASRIGSQIKAVADCMGDNTWLFGDKISHIDFLLYEGLDWSNLCCPGCYDEHKNLVKFVERVRALPGVEKYLKSSLKWPLFSPYAYWGGKAMAPTLGYWDVRGVCEPLRYLLHYLNVEFEDKRYQFGPEPNIWDSEYQNDKTTLGLDFPNLPYYIDGDVKLVQSNVIRKYLAKKHGLYSPSDEKAFWSMEVLEGQIMDLQMYCFFLISNPEFKKLRDAQYDRIQDKIGQISKFLGEKTWLMGDEISHIEFLAFEVFDRLRIMTPTVLDQFENIRNLLERFAELPGVKKYREGSKKWPMFAPLAQWGGKGEMAPM